MCLAWNGNENEQVYESTADSYLKHMYPTSIVTIIDTKTPHYPWLYTHYLPLAELYQSYYLQNVRHLTPI